VSARGELGQGSSFAERWVVETVNHAEPMRTMLRITDAPERRGDGL
jgi:hypothetical protein